MLQAGKDLLNKLKDGISSGISKIKDVGKELINGLWNGIKEKWEKLKSSVESLGKGIVSKFKSVFGIKSPSRVFRDEIGKQVSAGIGVGFEDELSSVYDDMQKAIDFETSKLSANVQTSATYQLATQGTPILKSYNDIIVEAKVDEGVLFRTNERLTNENNLQKGFSR